MRKLYRLFFLLLIHFVVLTVAHSQQLDLSFGNGTGKVLVPIVYGFDDQANSVAIQSDGKILLGGNSSGGTRIVSIARLNSDGTLDGTFNGNGTNYYCMLSFDNTVTAMKVKANQNIFISNQINYGNRSLCGVASLNTIHGSFDTFFHTTGTDTITVDTVNYQDHPTSLDISSTRLLIAGYRGYRTSEEITVAVLTMNGIFDNTFNSKGILLIQTLPGPAVCNAGIFQRDGKILLTGSYNGNFIVIRLNSDGSIDNTFGTIGNSYIDFGTTDDVAFSMVQQKDGKILIGGRTTNQFALARLKTDGNLDSTFGSNLNGKISFTTGAINSIAIDTFSTPNKIIIAGYSSNGIKTSFATARLDFNGNIEAQASIPMGTSNVSIANSAAILYVPVS